MYRSSFLCKTLIAISLCHKISKFPSNQNNDVIICFIKVSLSSCLLYIVHKFARMFVCTRTCTTTARRTNNARVQCMLCASSRCCRFSAHVHFPILVAAIISRTLRNTRKKVKQYNICTSVAYLQRNTYFTA